MLLGALETWGERWNVPVFYIVSIVLMFVGLVFYPSPWLIGGGLVLFLVILAEDARARGMIKPKSTRCDRCAHTFEERREEDGPRTQR